MIKLDIESMKPLFGQKIKNIPDDILNDCILVLSKELLVKGRNPMQTVSIYNTLNEITEYLGS